MDPDIFRVRDHPLLAQRFRLRSHSLQTDRADSCHCRESAAAFVLTFGLVEIRDALFGYDMAYIVAVDHDGGDWHSRVLANLHRVESLNECGNITLLKCLYGLYNELSTANNRLVLCNQI
jgi:hypothetical protein